MLKNAKKTPAHVERDRAKMDIRKSIAERLSELLDRTSESFVMTGAELAKKANISEGIISEYRQGNSAPAAEKLRKIALALNVSVDYLLGITKRSTTDMKLRSVSEFLGISEEATQNLKNLTDLGTKCALDAFLKCNNGDFEFFMKVKSYWVSAGAEKHIKDNPDNYEENYPTDHGSKYSKFLIQEQITDILNEIIGMSALHHNYDMHKKYKKEGE
ncbi:MAG: helix-turn-helix domain-containing protein [Defluviitaleaceae bacterium]|nr:helix-turn-helix domain-containing protein [Defluviitaleaceae bacterium]